MSAKRPSRTLDEVAEMPESGHSSMLGAMDRFAHIRMSIWALSEQLAGWSF